MITLYTKTGCPYCAKTLVVFGEHGVPFSEKNIADENIADELVREGGKRQVPYMIDGDVRMYESDDIARYINTTYGNGVSSDVASAPRLYTALTTGNVCIPKELQ